MIESCYKALKVDGIIRFNFAGDGNCFHLIDVLRSIITTEAYKNYFVDFKWPWYLPTINIYQQLLSENNFREIRIWDENADRYFKDEEEMIGWIDQPAIVPFITQINDSEKSSFRNMVISKMIDTTKQEDGRCFEIFRRINVYGKK